MFYQGKDSAWLGGDATYTEFNFFPRSLIFFFFPTFLHASVLSILDERSVKVAAFFPFLSLTPLELPLQHFQGQAKPQESKSEH